ncbi:MAG: hypothetical protein ACRYFR_13745 [Janthinobacterium lividum]
MFLVSRRRWWLAGPLAVLLWANWDAPEMHHFVRPAATAVWQLAPLGGPAARVLEARLAAAPGVAACAVSPRTGCVAFVYHPAETTPDALYQAVACGGARVVTPPPRPSPAALRQCPVPPGYLLLVDQVRFVLNLRRFFPPA